MQWQARAGQMADEWEIQRLARLYAYAMDNNASEVIDAIFTEDGELRFREEGFMRWPGTPPRGHVALREVPPMLAKRYFATLHIIHNQLTTVLGDDRAEGQTYCTAEHLEKDKAGGHTIYRMRIRYLDQYRRERGAWRFSCRELMAEWTDVRQVTNGQPRRPTL